MPEYIERENAIAWFMPYAHAEESIDADVVISDIKGMKAADVVPVRHGRWIAPFLSDGGNMCAECSNCHRIRIFDDYCSACGATMDLNDLED